MMRRMRIRRREGWKRVRTNEKVRKGERENEKGTF
jgi:hypothetical protein